MYIEDLLYNGFEMITERNLDDVVCGVCGVFPEICLGDGNKKIGTHCIHVACHLKPYDVLTLILQSISDNFDHKCYKLRCSQVRWEVQKFIRRFTNQFVNYAFDWFLLLQGLCLQIVYHLFTNLVNNQVNNQPNNQTGKQSICLPIRLVNSNSRNICDRSFVKLTVNFWYNWPET